VLRRLARRLPPLDPCASEEDRVEVVSRALAGARDAADPGGLLRALERYGLVSARRGDEVGAPPVLGSHEPEGSAAAGRDDEAEVAVATAARDEPTAGDPWPRFARRRRRAARERLAAMRSYLDARGCRRSALLRYFGEDAPEGRCGGCDRCGAL
jgi:hypothetical protein